MGVSARCPRAVSFPVLEAAGSVATRKCMQTQQIWILLSTAGFRRAGGSDQTPLVPVFGTASKKMVE